jgi:uncharacterized ParB-like nuclease family protein
VTALELRAADEPTTFKLSELTLDAALLLRHLDAETAASYAEVLKAKRELPPIGVMRVASDAPDESPVLLIVDGQHRYRAHQLAKREKIVCQVLDGDRAAACLASASANAEHGKQRSPEHKAAAVLALRAEPFYADKSVRWIADACRVSPTFASKVLATVHVDGSDEPRATKGKDGKIRKAPRKPKRPPFDAPKQVKTLARVIDQLAKKWPADVAVDPLLELLFARAADLEKRKQPAHAAE